MKKIFIGLLLFLALVLSPPVYGGEFDQGIPQIGGATDLTAITTSVNTAYATVASHATTSAIWAANGNIINFTGGETITALPAAAQAGSQRWLICAGTPTFTHNGTTLTVQGGVNYTAAAGDVVLVTATTTTAFKITVFKQSGLPTVLPTAIPLTSLAPQAAYTILANGTAGSASPTAIAPVANGIWGCNGSSVCTYYTNIRTDNTGAQFNDSVAPTKLAGVDPVNVTAGVTVWYQPVATTGPVYISTPSLTAGTYPQVLEGVATGGLIFGDSGPDAAGEIGYDGDLKYQDASALRTVANLDKAQTLTNKTLTAPVINGATGTGGKFTGDLTGLAPSVIVLVPSGTSADVASETVLTHADDGSAENAYVGMTLYNITDSVSGTVTASTSTTITVAAGSMSWANTNAYQLGPGPSQSGSVFYVAGAGTIRHPATVGYTAFYVADGTNKLTIDMASDSMVFTGTLDAAVVTLDAGDCIDSSDTTTDDFIVLHNKSATVVKGLGKRGTWADGGAS